MRSPGPSADGHSTDVSRRDRTADPALPGRGQRRGMRLAGRPWRRSGRPGHRSGRVTHRRRDVARRSGRAPAARARDPRSPQARDAFPRPDPHPPVGIRPGPTGRSEDAPPGGRSGRRRRDHPTVGPLRPGWQPADLRVDPAVRVGATCRSAGRGRWIGAAGHRDDGGSWSAAAATACRVGEGGGEVPREGGGHRSSRVGRTVPVPGRSMIAQGSAAVGRMARSGTDGTRRIPSRRRRAARVARCSGRPGRPGRRRRYPRSGRRSDPAGRCPVPR